MTAENRPPKFEVLSNHPLASTFYLEPEEDDHDDGRETEVLQYVYSHPSLPSMRGNPSAVLDVMDEYGRTVKFLMTIGVAKRQIMWEHFQQGRPKIVAELGSYVGYSAVALGGMLRELHPHAEPGEIKVWSFEMDPRWAAITMALVDLAGLKDIVQVVVGPAADSLKRLNAEGQLMRIDALLLDHWEKFYISDLQVCEELDLLVKGSMIFADNVLLPGAPDYLEYVGGGKPAKSDKFEYHSKGIESIIPAGWRDKMEVTKAV